MCYKTWTAGQRNALLQFIYHQCQRNTNDNQHDGALYFIPTNWIWFNLILYATKHRKQNSDTKQNIYQWKQTISTATWNEEKKCVQLWESQQNQTSRIVLVNQKYTHNERFRIWINIWNLISHAQCAHLSPSVCHLSFRFYCVLWHQFHLNCTLRAARLS